MASIIDLFATRSATMQRVTLVQTKGLFNAILPVILQYGALIFLGRDILKKEHGKRPGGMGTGSTEEDMWTTGFDRTKLLCDRMVTQADCGIKCPDPVPLSIKCTKSSIAVNWGKNKEKIDFQFIAPIMIIWHKPKPKHACESGVYVVDPEWCQANIVLSSNNKTDYMVDDKQVVKMMEHAKEQGMFAPITALEDKDEYFVYRNGSQGHAWPRLKSDLKPEIT
jgi:hypothetical protein